MILTPKLLIAVFPLLAFSASVLGADFTTIDISPYVNSNVAGNPQSFPTATTLGNQGTSIPFDIATYNEMAGNWSALNAASPLDVKVSVSGQGSFYALLNNDYGTPGANEYNVTIVATNGDSVTYQSVGGVDTRDYNVSEFTNSIANTTIPWFNNGIGQHLDLREFNLPASFANEAVSDFIITQEVPRDSALFSGLTFSTQAYNAAPEPGTPALVLGGILLAGLFRKLQRQ